MTLLPKSRPWRHKPYGRFVASLDCALTGDEGNDYLGIDPHHEPAKGNSGTSTKASDERQIPIRHDLHVRMETAGNSRASVYAEYGKNPEELIAQTQAAWIAAGNWPLWLAPQHYSEK